MNITQKKGAARTAWTKEEVTDVIALYDRMLALQRREEPYVKAVMVRALAEKLGRSKGSIEAKLMNVSGARRLADEQAEIVTGYKPLKNAQKLLITTVKAGMTMGVTAVILHFPVIESVWRVAA